MWCSTLSKEKRVHFPRVRGNSIDVVQEAMAEYVIVDELLCFIANKLQILQCEELIHMCTNVFTDVNIKDSKLKLFNAINSGPQHAQPITGIKYQNRKGAKSSETNLKDIISLFQELGAEAPKFAAVDLQRLPDMWDVHNLLTMVSRLSKELFNMTATVNKNSDMLQALQETVKNNAKQQDTTYAETVKKVPTAPATSTPPNNGAAAVLTLKYPLSTNTQAIVHPIRRQVTTTFGMKTFVALNGEGGR